MNAYDVLVIGAGVSGLTTAFQLSRAGFSVHVIEAAARAGGVIGSETRDGFLYERGPNSMLDSSGMTTQLLARLGIENERVAVRARAKNRFVVRNGKPIALPVSPGGLLTTPLFSARAKLRLLTEPLVPARSAADESIAAFVTRRAGAEFLDYAVEPFVAGIFAGDVNALSMNAALPRVHALEARHGGLIKGALASGRERSAAHGKPGAAKSFSFAKGMQTLTDALARQVSGVSLDTRAVAITHARGGALETELENRVERGRVSSRAVVIAVAASPAAALVRRFSSAAADVLESIDYAPIASVALSYARSEVGHPLDGFGFLVPRVENRRILGCLFSSSMFEGRAPPEHVLLTVFIGGQRNPELVRRSDEELVRLAAEELTPLIGTPAAPHFSAVTRWTSAIPQYTLGHLDRIAQLEAAEAALPGVFLCGSYRGGVSVGDCVRSAFRTADKVAAGLRR
jgi:oxygen-dependent protoporphyrinogen oxidase